MLPLLSSWLVVVEGLIIVAALEVAWWRLAGWCSEPEDESSASSTEAGRLVASAMVVGAEGDWGGWGMAVEVQDQLGSV